MSERVNTSLPWTIAVAVVLRPLEVLLQSAYIIAGRSTPAMLRGTNPATTMVLAVMWFWTSVWSDTFIRPGLFNWFGALWEIMAWTLMLRYLLRWQGTPERIWKTWLAVAGISTLMWLVSGVGFAIGLPPTVVSVGVFSLAIHGMGRIMQAALGGKLKTPFFSAGIWILLIGLSGLMAHHVLQVAGLLPMGAS